MNEASRSGQASATGYTGWRFQTAQSHAAWVVNCAPMSQNERIKEEIGWLKVVFGVLVAMGASIVAWLAQNYSTARPVLLIVTLFVLVGLVGGIIWVNRIVFRRLDQLEKL